MSDGRRCYIIGAGDFFGTIKKRENDLIIAADGGLKHLEKLSLKPDIIIGDFDSLGFVPEGENVIRLPVMKDETDTFAAVKAAIGKGYETVILLGCTGGKRSDHFLANLQTLLYASENRTTAYLIGENEIFTAVSNGIIHFKEKRKGFLSVFPFGDYVTVTIKGLLYETDNAIIRKDETLGTSNEFIGKKSSIEVKSGVALICWQGELTDIIFPA